MKPYFAYRVVTHKNFSFKKTFLIKCEVDKDIYCKAVDVCAFYAEG